MEDVVIVGSVRTPFGKFGGRLREIPTVQLAEKALRAVLERTGVPSEQVEGLIMGVGCLEAGEFVPARQVAVKSGLRLDIPSLTLDRACCSGMTATGTAWKDIRLGLRHVVAAVGAENLSRTPYLLPQARWGVRRGDFQVDDPLMMRSPVSGGTPIARYTGEVALRYGVSREAQDEWALLSHQRYGAALAGGRLDDEVLTWQQVLGGETAVPGAEGRADEQYRPDLTLQQLAKLKLVYESPTVTAGNAPGLNDGAVSALLMSRHRAEELKVKPQAVIVDYVEMAGDVTAAAYMPGQAILALLRRNGLTLDQIHVFDINEAFAATALCSIQEMTNQTGTAVSVLRERTNPLGGAIASGHPLGASGMRVVLNVIRVLAQRGGGYGVAAICGGFGQADAMLLRVDPD